MQDAQQDSQPLAETEVDSMLARLHGMVGGDPSFVSECLTLWMEDMASDLTKVKVAVVQADAQAVATCAHSMMGSCLTLSASQLHALAAQLEAQALSGTMDSIETKRQRLVALYERVCVVLEERVWRIPN